MKHLKIIFRTFLLLSAVVLTTQKAFANKDYRVEYFDSVEVSLLTCQPHDEVYSLYGHTALRWHDVHQEAESDIAFNWGIFNFKAPFFVIRFVFGLTDYELGGIPYRYFQEEYRRFGSLVTEQVLDLTSQEKAKLKELLDENLRPENRIYRYNYFYNNCTTKARDIIEKSISGKLEYTEREEYALSYREMIHGMTQNNPWSRFGNDILLGIKADFRTTRTQQEFLPDNLLYDFDHAQIYANGNYRPLVKERRIAVPAGVQMIEEGFPVTPLACCLILLAVSVVIFLLEYRQKRVFVWWDVTLMLLTSIIGIVLTLMLFSQHPTVSLNLQIILFNPLPLFYLWPVIRHRNTRYWQITAILAVLFLVGMFFQHYAEGIYFLALCLLLQSYANWKLKVQK